MWKQYYDYEVSNEGFIRNKYTQQKLKGNIKKNGYVEYCLYINNEKKYILGHRLVAELFLDKKELCDEINHIDGNKQNNSVENLEWVTGSENMLHAWENKLVKPHITRSVRQYDLNYSYIKTFNSISDAVKATGATKIREVANGNRKTSGGFIWEWDEDFIPEDRGRSKKVALLKDDFSIEAIYDSVSEAARITGASRKGISAVCLGKQKKCNNRYWKFLNDDMIQ